MLPIIKNIIIDYYYSIRYYKMQYAFKNNVSNNHTDRIVIDSVCFNYRDFSNKYIYICNFTQTYYSTSCICKMEN